MLKQSKTNVAIEMEAAGMVCLSAASIAEKSLKNVREKDQRIKKISQNRKERIMMRQTCMERKDKYCKRGRLTKKLGYVILQRTRFVGQKRLFLRIFCRVPGKS